MKIEYIGEYRKDTCDSGLFSGGFTKYWKNGHAFAAFTQDGLYWRRESMVMPDEPCVILTRAQGFRYWQKHFPRRPWWTLPAALQLAVNLYDDNKVIVISDGGMWEVYRDNL